MRKVRPGTRYVMSEAGRRHFNAGDSPRKEFVVVEHSFMRFYRCDEYYQGEKVGYSSQDLEFGLLARYYEVADEPRQQNLF